MKPNRHHAPGLGPAAKAHGVAPSHSDIPHGTTPNSCGHERVPPQLIWHYRTLLHLRDRLMPNHAGKAVCHLDLPEAPAVDSARDRAEHNALWTQLATEADPLFEIDCALQRIHDGLYGICEETGQIIAAERLLAHPWTRYAVFTRSVNEISLRGEDRL